MASTTKIQWLTILEEYRNLYDAIRFVEQSTICKHREKVVSRIKNSAADLELSFLKSPEQKPVCRYLSQVITTREDDSYSSLLSLIEKIKAALTWEYGYEKLPQELKEKYAYAEIMGPKGPIIGHNLILGLVLLGPECVYPEHSHDKIEESYLVLSGTVFVPDKGLFTPGSFIYNSPGEKHKLSTGNQPCLLAYAWTAEESVLKNNSMELGS